MKQTITSFVGQYSYLNPAYLHPIEWEGDTYPSILAAVEASKFDKDRRLAFRAGNPHMTVMGYVRPYTEVQKEVLRECLYSRFKEGTEFRKILDSTKGKELVDGNDAHRNWYGACSCSRCALSAKHNWVGNILMEIRDSSHEETPTP